MTKIQRWVGPVYLEPIAHKYHHRVTGKIYKSVTTTLSSIEPHFDAEGVALAITKQLDKVKQDSSLLVSTPEEIERNLQAWRELKERLHIIV